MTGTVSGAYFGVSYRIECPPPLASVVAASLPADSEAVAPSQAVHRFAIEPAEEDLFYVLRGPLRVSSAQTLGVAVRLLYKEICRAVAEYSSHCIFVHAGVLQFGPVAMIFPGHSHAGKSHLTWSLVEAGALYYSDEYAVLDRHGLIHPVPLPIHLRMPGGGRKLVVPERVGAAPVQPRVIAFTSYQPQSVWQPRELRPSETMLELIRHAIGIRRNPAAVLPVLRKVSMQARGFLGTRGEASELLCWASEYARSVTVAGQLLQT